jgi:hypothetical protein
MNALQAFCAVGGRVRVAAFRNGVETERVTFKANVRVTLRLPESDGSSPTYRNLIDVSGTLKYFHDSCKEFLDFSNSLKPGIRNVRLGFGFGDHINTALINGMLAKMPETGDKAKDFMAIEFTVDENNKAHRVQFQRTSVEELTEAASELIDAATSTSKESSTNQKEFAEGLSATTVME